MIYSRKYTIITSKDKVTHSWCGVQFNINNSVLILVQCCHIPCWESSFRHRCWSEGLKGEKARSHIEMNIMHLLLLELQKQPWQPKIILASQELKMNINIQLQIDTLPIYINIYKLSLRCKASASAWTHLNMTLRINSYSCTVCYCWLWKVCVHNTKKGITIKWMNYLN